MNINDIILSVVGCVRTQKIEGRKRLQKMVHLLKEAEREIPAEFRIHYYGPYSEDVADAADNLVFSGELEETLEPVGPYQTNQYLYQFTGTRSQLADISLQDLIRALDRFSTTELEVASTIAFYESEECSREQAIKETEFMKPNKAVPRVLSKAKEILDLIKEYRSTPRS